MVCMGLSLERMLIDELISANIDKLEAIEKEVEALQFISLHDLCKDYLFHKYNANTTARDYLKKMKEKECHKS